MVKRRVSSHRSSVRRVAVGALFGAAACAPLSRRVPDPLWSPDLAAPALFADVSAVDTIAQGVLHRFLTVNSGPWAIHELDIDRRVCWDAIAVKAGVAATGRETTSGIVRRLAADVPPAAAPSMRGRIAGAVNADFFLFEPPGVPQSAHIQDGRVITGPGERPVFAVDSAGRPWIGILRAEGRASSGAESIRIAAWNRHARTGLAYFDGNYGPTVDSARGSLRVALDGTRGGTVVSIDTAGLAVAMPREGSVLEVGRDAPADLRARVMILARTRARFEVSVRLTPFHPRDAVGGFPILVRDSADVPGLDSAGAATFAPVRHPRTLVGVGANGRRLMLITVDGRQAGYSAGMTLREAARLARDLGATQAINLDGGGSTTLVVARRDSLGTSFQVVNRPSDATGERPVGNALVIACRPQP
jgi:phosphodiester glycosidase